MSKGWLSRGLWFDRALLSKGEGLTTNGLLDYLGLRGKQLKKSGADEVRTLAFRIDIGNALVNQAFVFEFGGKCFTISFP